jgi:hypothetical protein
LREVFKIKVFFEDQQIVSAFKVNVFIKNGCLVFLFMTKLQRLFSLVMTFILLLPEKHYTILILGEITLFIVEG